MPLRCSPARTASRQLANTRVARQTATCEISRSPRSFAPLLTRSLVPLLLGPCLHHLPLIQAPIAPSCLAPHQNPASRGKRHNRLLLLIAVYKFLHALFFIAIGVGAHRLLHKDLADEIDLFARHLRFNPESRLVTFVLEKASLVNDPALAPHRLLRLLLRRRHPG